MKLVSVLLLLAPVLTICKSDFQPVDCDDIHRQRPNKPSGVYTIYPNGPDSAVEVYCDMVTDGGGWTVLQRRMDGSLNFYRDWSQYRMGFGSAAGEYWIGLEKMNQLTRRTRHKLRVDMEDFEENKAFARYSSFYVEAECQGFKLHVSGFSNGGAGDSLKLHNGQKFSTFDNDQDSSRHHCARLYLGGFWYYDCHQTNPNGIYRVGNDNTVHAVGVAWAAWKGNYSLKTFIMMVRPLR